MNDTVRRAIGILWRTAVPFLAIAMLLANPPRIFAAEGLAEDRYRSNYSKANTKPPYIVFSALVESLGAHEAHGLVGISIFRIQKNMRVTKQRAEEILDHFHSFKNDSRIGRSQVTYDKFCSLERSRPEGEEVGIAKNIVNDLKDLVTQKHSALLRLELTGEELPLLHEWIEKFQRNVAYFSFDHTKMQENLTDTEIDWQLDQMCADLEQRQLNY